MKQDDTKSRGFFVQIVQQNQVIKATKHESLTLFGKKPDKTQFFINGELCEDGEFRVDLPNQAMTIPGTILCEFSLRGSDNEMISTKDFEIIVTKSFPSAPVESVDEFGALTDALSQLNSFAGQIQDVLLYAEGIKAEIGDTDELKTEDKENLVGAINELEDRFNNINIEELEAFISGKIGSLNDLTTEERENLVGAINEVKASLDEVRITTDLDEIIPLLLGKADKKDLGQLSGLETDEKGSIVGAINELNSLMEVFFDSVIFEGIEEILEGKANIETIGDLGDLETSSKTTLVDAINEIKVALKSIEDVTNMDELILLLTGKANKADIGNLQGLTTENKATIVGAINEIQEAIVSIGEFVDIENIEDFIMGIVNRGAVSSTESVSEITTEHLNQVNVSKESSAGKEYLTYFVEHNGEAIEIDIWIYRNFEEDYLVDGGYVYLLERDLGHGRVELVRADEGEGHWGAVLYPVDTYMKHTELGQVNASKNCRASGEMSQVNASENCDANGEQSQINSSLDCVVDGESSQINSSSNCVVSESYSAMVGSSSSKISGQKSVIASCHNCQVESSGGTILSSDGCKTTTGKTSIIASDSIKNDTFSSLAMGRGPGNASTSNIKIHLLSMTGDINHSGVLSSGHNFTDYAEFFPNLTGEKQGYGLIQTIEGYGVRPANEGEQIAGVTSATAGVVLGDTPFSWVNRWLKDEWGEYITEEIYDESLEAYITVPKQNPEWNPELEQVSRKGRPDEWTIVGLMGQVYIRLKEDVEVMDYVEPYRDGVGQKSTKETKIRVMKITQDYDSTKGYKIGFCLLR